MNKPHTTYIQYLALILTLLPISVFADSDDRRHADTSNGPQLFGEIETLIHANDIYDSDEADNEVSEVYTHSEIELELLFNEHFSIQAEITLEGESVAGDDHHGDDDGGAGHDRFFDDHPLFIEQFLLNYETEHFDFYAGKFNPIVSLPYHDVPGIYTYHFMEEYSIEERIGFGGTVKVDGGDYGKHHLDISTFYADTTWMSNSILSKRGDLDKEDGGVANTESFDSFAVSLGGDDLNPSGTNFVKDLYYRVGFAHQEAGVDNDDDETRYSVSLGYDPQLTEAVSARTFIEYVSIDHLEGEADHDRDYLTAVGGLYWGPWNAAVSYIGIFNDADEHDEHQDGHIFQVSGGYQIQDGLLEGLGFDLGWRDQEEEDIEQNLLNARLSYELEF